jgi:Mg2+-importing ATPase
MAGRRSERLVATATTESTREFWDQTLDEILRATTSGPQGLTSTEAQSRLDIHGPNELARRGYGAAFEILRFFVNPLVIILLFASLVSGVLGEYVNSGLIALMVIISVALNFFQAYRSQQAAEALRQTVVTTATALRDGQWVEVPQREIVPGDVVRLAAGDLVPADGELLESHDLFTDEAALTGESLPVEKTARPAPGVHPLADAQGAVFLGTSVISGAATALIVHTGRDTQIGHVAQHLVKAPPQTEFDRGTRSFGLLIMRTVVVLTLFVFLVNGFVRHSPLLESFLFAIALAVGLTPEFLPMIMSVTLARGAMHMARRKVIVKRLAAIENFGSMSILCSDKTGTLTEGQITLEQHVDITGEEHERVILFAVLNGAFETGIKSPLDEAIVRHEHPTIEAYTKRDEIPFDFQRRRSSVVVSGEGRNLLVVKGAPESVMPFCTRYEQDGEVGPLDPEKIALANRTFNDLSADGYRVLAIAFRDIDARGAYSVSDETDLTLSGFAAFLDPPRESARATIQALQSTGIRLKIMTGDNELVTKMICHQVGLNGADIVLGTQIDETRDEALGALAERTTVFARVSPEQKNRVMAALRRRGHVVGFMGDGINDAPSLHNADVGISVAGAVDVAKEAADIILLERSLAVLLDGVLEGRKSFGNIMKYILMGTSSNFGNMFSMAGASLFLPFLPMLPFQILLNNFLYDLSQITIPGDRVDDTYLQNPKRWQIGFIQKFMLIVGPISSIYDFLTFGALLWLFNSSEKLFHTGWFVESLATQTLVIMVIRTSGLPWKSRPSTALIASVVGAVLVAIALPYSPLAPTLGFVAPPPTFYAFLVVAVATYLALVEVVKRRFYRRYG